MARPRKTPVAKQPAIAVHNKYDAAGTGRRMKGWMPPSSGPNKAIQGIQNIRNRARDVVRNDWSGESATQKWVTNLVGTGITPRLKRITDKARKEELHDLWLRWVPMADADGVLDFYGMQALVVRAWLDSGEVFVRKRYRRVDSGMEVPVQVQLLEAEFVPMFDADTWPFLPVGHKIRQGIELDRRGQRVAYWMYREHPGEDTVASMSNLLRIPASEVKHVFEVKRPGQLRGVSALASVLARLRSIGDYDDAVLERQKLANLFTAFITRGLGSDIDVDPMTNLPLEFGSDGTPLAGLQPGLIQELDYGQDIKFANPPEAGTTYSDYMRTQHLGTSAAAGIPYEVFSGDIKEVSDRTLRVVINEFRRFAEQRQWHTVIPMFCQPVRDWWTQAAALAGHISEAEINPVKMVEWAPHGWSYIHPVQDPQGKKLEVESGFRSRSSVVGERGDDPDTVDAERAADIEREKTLGLYMDPTGQTDANGKPIVQPEEKGDEDGIDNEEYSAPPNAELLQQFAVLAQQMTAIQAALMGGKAEPTSLVINNHIPPTTVENRVDAPVVNVAAPDVKVEAPTVNVAAPTVNVEPTPVTVQNNVLPAKLELPARKTETTIERDQYGNLVRTTQIETDAE
jgi:lambda family phage portal protein